MPPSKRKTRGGSGASESSDVSPAKVRMGSIQGSDWSSGTPRFKSGTTLIGQLNLEHLRISPPGPLDFERRTRLSNQKVEISERTCNIKTVS